MKRIFILCLVLLTSPALAQVFSNKVVGKKNEALADSLKKSDYPYVLPIWGEKATKRGFNLPYSAGLSAQYFSQESLILIDNLSVGFNNGTMYNLDGLVRFDEAKATASAFTIRPDVWVLPFLNVYGILGKAQASTNVNFGLWVPDSTGVDKQVFSTGTVIEFNTSTFGLGMTPTIGIGGGFLALDMNIAWTDVPQLKHPARTFVFGPRFGKSFKLRKPESNIAIWVGGFRVSVDSDTDGSMALSDVFGDGSSFGSRVDAGIVKVEDAQQQVDAWWAGLSPLEQNSPVNKAKYNGSTQLLARAGEILHSADQAVNTITSSTVQYKMEKTVKDPWNFIVGSQYQLNKHLMFRAEVGFLGSRDQYIVGVQYRFGL